MLKVLFLAANPLATGRLQLDEEIRLISRNIRAADLRDEVEVRAHWATRPDDLLQLLNEYKPHVVHFSGHGSADGKLILAQDDGSLIEISPKALCMLFTTLKDDIRLVIFNACFSQSGADEVSRTIDFTVGMATSITDKAAALYASSFYRALAFGRSVADAHNQGLTAIVMLNLGEEDTPVLFHSTEVDPARTVLAKRLGAEQGGGLEIDDVQVLMGARNVRLDVRLRNSGPSTVNITRADLHVLERQAAAAIVPESAEYQLALAGEHNEISVAHVLQAGEVDRFSIVVGFTTYNSGCWFRCRLTLRYNGNKHATSETFSLNSFFDQ